MFSFSEGSHSHLMFEASEPFRAARRKARWLFSSVK